MSGLTAYMILKLDSILTILEIASVISIIIFGICMVTQFAHKPIRDKIDSTESDYGYVNNNVYDWSVKYKYKFIGLFILLISLITIIPNTNQAFTIYIIPKITNNKAITGLPEKLSKLLDLKIREIN